MNQTPCSLRAQIGIFGRVNVGKSSLLNLLAGQDTAIVSSYPGTTTDVVEKPMELLPFGPVLFLDTAGLNDASALAQSRVVRSRAVFDRCDIVLLVVEPDVWTTWEDEVVNAARGRGLPVIIAVNKTDLHASSERFKKLCGSSGDRVLECSSADASSRDRVLKEFKSFLTDLMPSGAAQTPLIGDLVRPGHAAVLIIPIDSEAPKSRIILPQVQTIRDLLDHGAVALVCTEKEYRATLGRLTEPPDIVVCDSQVVDLMVRETPPGVPCTTFSILFARWRGDLEQAVRGAAAIDRLKPGDRVLIAEACSHHAMSEDIGRVKIPSWLERRLGFRPVTDVCSGPDYPADLSSYRLVIHCGGCMINRRQMSSRIAGARAAGVPITNYGVCIAFMHGALIRVLEPFPGILRRSTPAVC